MIKIALLLTLGFLWLSPVHAMRTHTHNQTPPSSDSEILVPETPSFSDDDEDILIPGTPEQSIASDDEPGSAGEPKKISSPRKKTSTSKRLCPKK